MVVADSLSGIVEKLFELIDAISGAASPEIGAGEKTASGEGVRVVVAIDAALVGNELFKQGNGLIKTIRCDVEAGDNIANV